MMRPFERFFIELKGVKTTNNENCAWKSTKRSSSWPFGGLPYKNESSMVKATIGRSDSMCFGSIGRRDSMGGFSMGRRDSMGSCASIVKSRRDSMGSCSSLTTSTISSVGCYENNDGPVGSDADATLDPIGGCFSHPVSEDVVMKYGYEDAAPDVSLRNSRYGCDDGDQNYDYIMPLVSIRKPSNDERPSLYEYIQDGGMPTMPSRKPSNDPRPLLSYESPKKPMRKPSNDNRPSVDGSRWETAHDNQDAVVNRRGSTCMVSGVSTQQGQRGSTCMVTMPMRKPSGDSQAMQCQSDYFIVGSNNRTIQSKSTPNEEKITFDYQEGIAVPHGRCGSTCMVTMPMGGRRGSMVSDSKEVTVPSIIKCPQEDEKDYGYEDATPDVAKINERGTAMGCNFAFGSIPQYQKHGKTHRRSSLSNSVSPNTTERWNPCYRGGRRASIGYGGEITVSLPGKEQPVSRPRFVNFCEELQTRDITPLHQLAPKESLWFQKDEFKTIRNTRYEIAKMVRKGKTGFCTRGLENLVGTTGKDHTDPSHDAISKSLKSVMKEQTFQRDRGYFDADYVAKIYSYTTEQAALDAARRAQRDFEEIHDDYGEVARYLERTRKYASNNNNCNHPYTGTTARFRRNRRSSM